MKIFDLFSSLEREFYDACKDYIALLVQDFPDEQLYAFAVLRDGSEAIGITANTVQALDKRIKFDRDSSPAEFQAPDIYFELSVAEWVHMNGHWNTLSPVTDIIEAYRERLYAETGFDDLG